jgi:hypothetical protein
MGLTFGFGREKRVAFFAESRKQKAENKTLTVLPSYGLTVCLIFPSITASIG